MMTETKKPDCPDCPVKAQVTRRNRQIRDLRKALRSSTRK